ncbi:Bacitracin ABC transporter ATP-binding protein OS=Lysinibacillus sphaericus OX=1421 GN=bceA_2 PE=3 SV=1 [Lysinibacillus sphaericus]
MAVLIGRKVKKVYGKKSTAQEVLKGIDLEVNEGEFVGIMGPLGSGKTTLLNCCVRLILQRKVSLK